MLAAPPQAYATVPEWNREAIDVSIFFFLTFFSSNTQNQQPRAFQSSNKWISIRTKLRWSRLLNQSFTITQRQTNRPQSLTLKSSRTKRQCLCCASDKIKTVNTDITILVTCGKDTVLTPRATLKTRVSLNNNSSPSALRITGVHKYRTQQ